MITKNTAEVDWKAELRRVKQNMVFLCDIEVAFYFASPVRITFCKQDNPDIAALSWKTKTKQGHLRLSKPRWVQLTEGEKSDVIEKAKLRFLALAEMLINLGRLRDAVPGGADDKSGKERTLVPRARTLVFDGDNSWVEQSTGNH